MRSISASSLVAALVACAVLATGCSERPRTNPLDSENPETGGGPQNFRAVAGSATVGLEWRAAPTTANLLGFLLERRRTGQAPFVAVGPYFPLASTGYDDDQVEDDFDYEYRLSFIDEDSLVSGTQVSAFARPGREVVWVADPGADELVRLTPDGRARVRTVANVRRTNRISIDVGDGAVWATEPFDGRVKIFTALGAPLANFHVVDAPNPVVVDPASGSAWIGDEDLGGVVRVGRLGNAIAAAGLFNNPQDLALVAGGGAWVVDSGAGTVTRIDASGDRGPVAPLGGDPRRAAVDALDGTVWVTRFAAGEVMKLSSDGDILARTALGPGPYAVDIDEGRNLVWVGVDGANAVVALDRTGGGEVRRVEGIFRPRGLAVADRTGEVWVAAIAAGEIVRISSAGTVLGRTAGFAAPFDVKVDPGPRPVP